MLRRLFGLQKDPVREARMADQLKWRLRTGLIMTLALAALLTSPIMALAGSSTDDFIVDGRPVRAEKMLRPFSVIKLDNGDEISFIGIPNERGRVDGVLVTDKGSAGRAPLRSVEGLRDANPLELFNALAESYRRVPTMLVDLYADDSTLGQQGWARDLVMETGGTSDVYCPATQYFLDDMDEYAGDMHDEDPFMSLYDGPTTKPNHWKWTGGPGTGGLQGYDLHGQANDTTAFYSQVFYCYEDWENAETLNGQYIGNYVNSYFRPAGHGPDSWKFSDGTQLTDAGDYYEHIYVPGNRFSPSADEFDFHVEILDAKPADQFHIGATWVYGGPTDIKYGG